MLALPPILGDSSKFTSWLLASTQVSCIPLAWKSGQSALCKSCKEREVKTGRQGQILRRGIYMECGLFLLSLISVLSVKGVPKAGCCTPVCPLFNFVFPSVDGKTVVDGNTVV